MLRRMRGTSRAISQPLLQCTFYEDLPDRYSKCYQFADGSIICLSNTTPNELFINTNGKRLNADLSALGDMEHVNQFVEENALFLLMFDKERYNEERKCHKIFRAAVKGNKLVIKLVNVLNLNDELVMFAWSPHTLHQIGDQIHIRHVTQREREAPLKSIKVPDSVPDGYQIFFKGALYVIRNSRTEMKITRINDEIVLIETPLRNDLSVHGYDHSDTLYLFHFDEIIALNTETLTHRLWRIDRPCGYYMDDFDYSVGVYRNQLTLRLVYEAAHSTELYTVDLPY
ncbi:hypothetical protein PFISCL1PPCAC_11121 [Pristionchus fissidentatus]|uniref:DUF295 domain-containing protein n=1 Tax=Pristionchus fissidentatus TaxID=1538716 RepID=A0AAV5VPX0_9BILA|nr:hypothetical protein PFISCL1PPCAC_11121 [Pristionchus fissidentatus]